MNNFSILYYERLLVANKTFFSNNFYLRIKPQSFYFSKDSTSNWDCVCNISANDYHEWGMWSAWQDPRWLRASGIRGLQYGGDGRQYAAGGLPAGQGGGWGYEDEGGYGYGEEDTVEDLNARMAAMTADQRKAAIEAAQRSQSSKRYQEMERERKRRQLKTQGGQEKTSFFQSTKLALMNSGLIPLKKGEIFLLY